MIERSFKNKKN